MFRLTTTMMIFFLLAAAVYGATSLVSLKTPLAPAELKAELATDPALYYSLGTFLAHRGLFGQAQAALEHSLLLKEDPKTFYNLGYAHYAQGDALLAEEAFRHAVFLKQDYAKAWNGLGILALEKKDFQGAADYLEKTVVYRPDDPSAWFDLGLAYTGMFRATDDASYGEQAMASFSHALMLKPDFREAAANIAVLERFV